MSLGGVAMPSELLDFTVQGDVFQRYGRRWATVATIGRTDLVLAVDVDAEIAEPWAVIMHEPEPAERDHRPMRQRRSWWHRVAAWLGCQP